MSAPTRRLTSGPLRDGLAINVRELADAANMSVNATRKSILDLESKGFLVGCGAKIRSRAYFAAA